MSRSRSAEATIKGFNYQFDASILSIIGSTEGQDIVIEGVEDVDLVSDKSFTAIQCKYYEKTSLTNSVLREIIEPMLKDYLQRSDKIDYRIYGHFKSVSDFELKDEQVFKKSVLKYSKIIAKKKVEKNLADDLKMNLPDIKGFLKQLKIECTSKYTEHKESVVKAIQEAKDCSLEEALSIYYPNAFTLVSELATKNSKGDRTISKESFLNQIDSKQVIFSRWQLEAMEVEKYCKAKRKHFFTQTNISPYARFFIIESIEGDSVAQVSETLQAIAKKWSTHKKRRMQQKDRYAPYILIRSSEETTLKKIKKQLFDDKIGFVDGYPFKESDFEPEFIQKKQTSENQLSLRILNSEEELNTIIENTSQTKEIYEFFHSTRMQCIKHCKHIQMPITSLSMLTKII